VNILHRSGGACRPRALRGSWSTSGAQRLWRHCHPGTERCCSVCRWRHIGRPGGRASPCPAAVSIAPVPSCFLSPSASKRRRLHLSNLRIRPRAGVDAGGDKRTTGESRRARGAGLGESTVSSRRRRRCDGEAISAGPGCGDGRRRRSKSFK
jgi:hypothetical protein